MTHSHMLRRNQRSFKKTKVLADLPSLIVPDALEDGRLPLASLADDIEILIPTFPGLKENDEFKLYMHQNYFGVHYIVSADDEKNPDFKVSFYIGKEDFPPEGAYVEVPLDYEYVDADTLEAFRSGKVVKLIFDREPPGGASLRALGFTQEQREGITEDNIEAGYLSVTAYAWYGMDMGDFITPWVSELPPIACSQEQYLINEAEIEIKGAGTSTLLKFPADRFRGVGDRYFGYQLRDKLGNTSPLSPTVKIGVDLETRNIK
ncbi:MAG: hypothetical protein JWQ16_3544 [Novosphingobium sp.]|nr:hypothetical protein [Novosphingobium sp.]